MGMWFKVVIDGRKCLDKAVMDGKDEYRYVTERIHDSARYVGDGYGPGDSVG